MEEEKKEEEMETGASQWIKDNLRIIISVIIVIAIAGGIYSYSKRTQPTTVTEETAMEEGDQGTAGVSDQEGAIEVQEEKGAGVAATTEPGSKETEASFIETAGSGDGVTHLARRALANYLEKNPDSSLTPEHKIYIEDYLRKKVGFKGRVFVGTSAEFSKDLIQESINASKKLNENQLRNLHKYAVMVPSLS
jgi:hypothetical protein